MFFYLREQVDPDEWALKYLVLQLHDATSRIKSMRAWYPAAQYSSLIAGRNTLIEEIKSGPAYALLDDEIQKRLVTGEEIYVGGMRRAATLAGWRSENFVAIYSYLSAQSHSAPMSYLRMRLHSIDYFKPSEYQYGVAGLAIEISAACLRRVTVRYLDEHIEQHPETKSKFPLKFLDEVHRDDASCDIFTTARFQSQSTESA